MNMSMQDLAWLKAQAVYCEGDTEDRAGVKAMENGYLPGTPAYAAFIGGFLEMIPAALPEAMQ